MSGIDIYNVALDCSIDNYSKSPSDMIFGTYGELGNFIGTNVPVVFTLEDAHQTGIKLVNHVLKYGPMCKKTDMYGSTYMFPVRGYIIVKYRYNGTVNDFIYNNELKNNYAKLMEAVKNDQLTRFTVNGIPRGIINRGYWNQNTWTPQIFVVEEPRVKSIVDYINNYGLRQRQLLQSYPILPIPVSYPYMNQHSYNYHSYYPKKDRTVSSSSAYTSKQRYKNYMGGASNDTDADAEFDKLYEDKYHKYKQKYLDLKNDN